MDYPTTLRVAMHAYPSLFPTEWSALESFLFTIGNGMRWQKNGELSLPMKYSRNPDEEIRLSRESAINRERADFQKDPSEFNRRQLDLALSPIEDQWKAEIAYRRSRIKVGARSRAEALLCWRPMRGGKVAAVAYPCGTDFGAINSIPKHIEPSWRSALAKCRDYINSGHIRFRTPAERDHAMTRLSAALDKETTP